MAGPSGNETNHTLDGLTIRGGLSLMGDAGVQTYLNRDVVAMLARLSTAMRAGGYYAETSPRNALPGTQIATDGTLYGVAIGLLAGDVVSSMTMLVQTAGTGMSIAKIGLYSKTGNTLLCSSADQSTAFNSSGMKTAAMTTPYTVPTDDLYYAAFLGKTATTMPTPMRGTQGLVAAANAGIGNGIPYIVLQAAQTDFPATATLAGSSSSVAYWFGVS